jgi:hypothetical protein
MAEPLDVECAAVDHRAHEHGLGLLDRQSERCRDGNSNDDD